MGWTGPCKQYFPGSLANWLPFRFGHWPLLFSDWWEMAWEEGRSQVIPYPAFTFHLWNITGNVCIFSVVHIPSGSLHGGFSSYGSPSCKALSRFQLLMGIPAPGMWRYLPSTSMRLWDNRGPLVMASFWVALPSLTCFFSFLTPLQLIPHIMFFLVRILFSVLAIN